MKIRYILILCVLFLISGCSQIDLGDSSNNDLERISSNNFVVCNSPYIRFATTCCLDENNNSICDKDESVEDDNFIQKKIHFI